MAQQYEDEGTMNVLTSIFILSSSIHSDLGAVTCKVKRFMSCQVPYVPSVIINPCYTGVQLLSGIPMENLISPARLGSEKCFASGKGENECILLTFIIST
jgi:hypothetical protein